MKSNCALAALLVLVSNACSAVATPVAEHRGSGAPERGAAASELELRFPRASRSLAVGGADRALSLAELAKSVSLSTGLVYSFDARTQRALEEALPVLTRPEFEVAPEQLYRWFETLLLQHGFVVSAPTALTPPLAFIELATGSLPASAALDVPFEHLALLAEHPALRVALTLRLPHLDVRTLGNSLRSLTSQGQNSILPVANTNSLVLSGDGHFVRNCAELLLRVDQSCERDLALDQREVLQRELEARPQQR